MEEETIKQRIAQLQEEISQTPYHKGTEHHIGRLRAKVARLKDELVEKQTASSGGGGGGYAPGKSGDATVVLVGFPSVGKSTLLNALTAAHSKTAHYPFTTLKVIPGMLKYRGAAIQILDVPGLITGAARGRGRGKEVLSVVRAADLVLFVVDGQKPKQLTQMRQELTAAGLRLNQSEPQVTVNKTDRGGIVIKNPGALVDFSPQTAKEIAREFRLKNVEIILGEEVTQERFIDALSNSRVYLPGLVVVNKMDLLTDSQQRQLKKQLPPAIFISAQEKINLETLQEAIYQRLALKRIYLKPADGEPDFEEPLIIRGEKSVAGIRQLLPEEVTENKRAFLSGPSAKFPDQPVSDNHIVEDEDIICFR